MLWCIRPLHAKACGCEGPCEELDADSRIIVNAAAERRRALKEAIKLAPELVGLSAQDIQIRLVEIVKTAFDSDE